MDTALTSDIRAFYESLDPKGQRSTWAKMVGGKHQICNGHYLVEIDATEQWHQDTEATAEKGQPDMDDFLAGMPTESLGFFTVPVYKPPIPVRRRCDLCTTGTHECRCGHRHKCQACDGEGFWWARPVRLAVRIHRDFSVMDERLLAAALAFAPRRCELRVGFDSDNNRVAWFAAEGFRAAIMPLDVTARATVTDSYYDPA